MSRLRARKWLVLIVAGLALPLRCLCKGVEDMPTLNWLGRKEATTATKDVVMKILREDKSLSCGDVASGNLLVHGDNLEALMRLFS